MFQIDRSEKNPNRISVATGNVCNLACTLCGPESSSRWQNELKQYMPATGKELYDTNLADFSGAVSVTIGGGEPVLNKSTLPLLKKIESTTPVIIHFNCTVLPSEQLLAECERFDNINFTLSIDDTEERFEFLRWPAKWSTAVKNIHWMIQNVPENIKFSVNTVISKLNEKTFHTVKQWATANIPAHRLSYCETNESTGILSRFKPFSFLSFADETDYLDTLDSRRKTNWRKTFPLAQNIT